ASNVNQTFDYYIPEKFKPIVQKGMRVVIPFGPRKITGFIIGFTDESEFKKLREIIDVLDIIPALTDELLELGKWLANQTMSLYITTYQAMLPQVLKSKYERTLVRLEKNLQEELSLLFNGLDEIDYNLIHESNINLETVKKSIKSGLIKEKYKVKSKITKKKKILKQLSIMIKGLDEIDNKLIKESNINLETVQKSIKYSLIKYQYKIKSKITKKYKSNFYPSETSILKEYEKNLPHIAHRQK